MPDLSRRQIQKIIDNCWDFALANRADLKVVLIDELCRVLGIPSGRWVECSCSIVDHCPNNPEKNIGTAPRCKIFVKDA